VTKAKFVSTDKSRLLQVTIKAVSLCHTRTGLIEIYKAALITFGKGTDLDSVIEACQKRQTEISG
jgi:hypothetical protein